MSNREVSIDRIEAVGGKGKPQWVNLGAADIISEPKKNEGIKPVDSLESLTQTMARESASEEKTNEKNPVANQKKQETSPGFWSKVWSGICGLFGRSTAATTPANSGGSNQPGGDGVSSVGGSPTLEAPYMFDLKKFTQMLKETRDALNQVKETNNDADEEFTKAGSEKSQERLLQHLKAQREIYEEGAALVKTKYVSHQEKQREVRKQLSDAKNDHTEISKKERAWGWWQKAASFGVLTVVITGVAIAAIATAGLSVGAAFGALSMGMKILAPLTLGMKGITDIMHSSMNQQLKDRTGTVTTLHHLNGRISQYLVPDDISQMNQSWDQALKIVTEHLKRQEENRNNTIKSIVSDMSAAR